MEKLKLVATLNLYRMITVLSDEKDITTISPVLTFQLFCPNSERNI